MFRNLKNRNIFFAVFCLISVTIFHYYFLLVFFFKLMKEKENYYFGEKKYLKYNDAT